MMRFRWTPESYPRLTARALQLASLVTRRPSRSAVRALCAESFTEQVSVRELVLKLRALAGEHGRVVGIEPLRVSAENIGQFVMLTDRPARILTTMTLELEEPARIAEFTVACESLEPDFEGVRRAFQELPGQAGLSLWRLAPDGPQELLAYEPERPLSIASAFKLYVLGALVDSGLAWDTPLVLTQEARAFPSGFLHQWPEGMPLTLESVATLMISISDNTATELLMERVGREAVEASVQAMGNAHPALLTPMMSALDFVRLKGDPGGQRGQLYLHKDVAGRREMLADLAHLPRERVGISPLPRHLELGWWAAPADLCRAQAWLWARSQPDDPVRQLLAVNPGVITSLPYTGFKGGGDAGVVSASFLLEDRTGATYALGAAWNNPRQSVNEARFFALLESLMWALPATRVASRPPALRPPPAPPPPTLWERLFG